MTVSDVKGNCNAGFKVGDTIVFIGDKVIDGKVKCVYGVNAVWPLLHTIAYGGKIPSSSPFSEGNETFVGCCPDPKNLVTFKMKREGAYWRTPDSTFSKETHSFTPIPKNLDKEEE